MKISVEELKQKYPNPVRSKGSNKAGYCVGGALVLWTLKECTPRHSFPGNRYLANVLVKVNSKLLPGAANRFADDIIELNDGGLFYQAWDKLAEALEYISQS